MKLNNHGFTLIELIVVVVILAILAVAAVPKMLSYHSAGQSSVIYGVSAALDTSLQLVSAQIAIDNATKSVNYNGQTITLSEGMPEASIETINSLLDIQAPLSWTTNWDTEACDETEFCIVGHLYPGKYGYIDIPQYNLTRIDNIVYIWPKGYLLNDSEQCFSFYINKGSTRETFHGSVTTNC